MNSLPSCIIVNISWQLLPENHSGQIGCLGSRSYICNNYCYYLVWSYWFVRMSHIFTLAEQSLCVCCQGVCTSWLELFPTKAELVPAEKENGSLRSSFVCVLKIRRIRRSVIEKGKWNVWSTWLNCKNLHLTLRPVHIVWFFSDYDCDFFAHNGLHSWWCCRSRTVWTLPFSPDQPTCCNKKNRGCNRKKYTVWMSPYVERFTKRTESFRMTLNPHLTALKSIESWHSFSVVSGDSLSSVRTRQP